MRQPHLLPAAQLWALDVKSWIQRSWNKQLQSNINNMLAKLMKLDNSHSTIPHASTSTSHAALSQHPHHPKYTTQPYTMEQTNQESRTTGNYPPTPTLNNLIMAISRKNNLKKYNPPDSGLAEKKYYNLVSNKADIQALTLPLDQQAALILGLDRKMNKIYKPAVKQYEALAINNHWTNFQGNIWPIAKEHLMKFITHMHDKVAPLTLLSYLSALKHHHKMNHLNWNEIRNDPLVNQLLKTINQNHVHKPVKQKSHITRHHLRTLKANLNFNNPDDKLFWAIALSAFYSLAHLRELLPTTRQDIDKVSSLCALTFEKVGHHTYATIQLARTKVHKSATRTSLTINLTYDDLCLIDALKTYIVQRTNPTTQTIVTIRELGAQLSSSCTESSSYKSRKSADGVQMLSTDTFEPTRPQ
ncbi:950_t:CDS:2 [Racocetra persica]|uniref:950_t:CDS:1 n=1 Tax=Racocetra persica TaxID=160502 RepID=A0ACA9LA03_9GLOM|nr:950_t:CDS:2 [Racocetra persica]